VVPAAAEEAGGLDAEVADPLLVVVHDAEAVLLQDPLILLFDFLCPKKISYADYFPTDIDFVCTKQTRFYLHLGNKKLLQYVIYNGVIQISPVSKNFFCSALVQSTFKTL